MYSIVFIGILGLTATTFRTVYTNNLWWGRVLNFMEQVFKFSIIIFFTKSILYKMWKKYLRKKGILGFIILKKMWLIYVSWGPFWASYPACAASIFSVGPGWSCVPCPWHASRHLAAWFLCPVGRSPAKVRKGVFSVPQKTREKASPYLVSSSQFLCQLSDWPL